MRRRGPEINGGKSVTSKNQQSGIIVEREEEYSGSEEALNKSLDGGYYDMHATV